MESRFGCGVVASHLKREGMGSVEKRKEQSKWWMVVGLIQ